MQGALIQVSIHARTDTYMFFYTILVSFAAVRDVVSVHVFFLSLETVIMVSCVYTSFPSHVAV